jgi:hypothetical protein
LEDIVNNAKYVEVRKTAVDKLEDSKLLANLAAKADSVGINFVAVKQLDPKEWDTLLLEIQENDENEDVRKAAKKRRKLLIK